MNRNTFLVLALIALITGASYFILSQPRQTNVTNFSTDTTQEASSAPEQAATDSASATAQGLKIEDLTVGTGAEAKDKSLVTVHYKGTLENGTQFDASYDRGQPFTTPWTGSVIKGWDLGIPGMKVGGKRKLTIPPSLGYGAQGQGSIPPNSTLIFEVELIEVRDN